mgnify:CR=1 FL=1
MKKEVLLGKIVLILIFLASGLLFTSCQEEEKKEIVESIAKTVFEYEKNLEAYDALQIKISSGFDIGIASGNVHQGFTDSIDNWRKGIDLDGTSGNLTTPL